MSWSILAAAIWAVLATGVALLPMRLQYVPGLTLLFLAPAIILWLGFDEGWVIALAGLLGFLSMFRYPLRYFWRKWRGTLPDAEHTSERGEQA